MEKEVLAILIIFSVISLSLFFMMMPKEEKLYDKAPSDAGSSKETGWGKKYDSHCGTYLAEEYHKIDTVFFTMPLIDPKARDKTPQERAQATCQATTSKIIVERLKKDALQKLTTKDCNCPPKDNPECSIPEGPRIETNFDCEVKDVIHPKTNKVTHYEVYRRGNAFAYCACKEPEAPSPKPIELPVRREG